MLNLRKILVFVLSLLITSAYAQNISVVSFQKLENDLTARTQSIEDQNGEPCALIKIVVTGSGFMFEGDGLGIVKTKHKTGEYYIYVPRGAKYLTIKHNDYGVLRQYAYPEKIEKQTTYEMKITLGKVEADGNYLIIKVQPAEAAITVDGEVIDRDITPFLKSGEHFYKIECENYTTKEGKLTISKSEKTKLEVKLERSHGYLTVNYTPEDALIYIDNKLQTEKTPARLYLESGQHNLRVSKERYETVYQQVTIKEGVNHVVAGRMKETAMGKVYVSTNVSNSKVYIDNKEMGPAGQSYDVAVGSHQVKITHSGYYDAIVDVMVKNGETKKVKKDLTMTKEKKQEEQRNKKYSKSDNPSRGFRWFIDAGAGYNVNEEVSDYVQYLGSTTIGYQFVPAIYLGIGAGCHYYKGIATNTEKLNIDSFMTFPAFGYLRWETREGGRNMFADIYCGYTLKEDICVGYSVGYRYKNASLSIGAEHETYDYLKTGESGSKTTFTTMFLKVSVDFGARRIR